jgi:hypothetical protein
MSKELSINVLIPCTAVRVVKVSKSDLVSVLRSHLGMPSIDFIFNGQLLSSERTFDFYRVGNNESLVAVDPGRQKSHARWLKITEEQDDFSNSIQCAVDPKCRGEYLRLRDLRRMRIESRPRAIRRTAGVADRDGFSAMPGETVVRGPTAEIPCEPLPMLFRED